MQDSNNLREQARKCRTLAKTAIEPELIEQLRVWSIELRGDRGGRHFAKGCRRSPSATRLGRGGVTLLGDAIHATTPNLGQGACQALEDAVVLADSLRRCASAEDGLRDYEARRHHRANFVIGQSRRIGTMAQLASPVGVWLREVLGATSWAQKRTERLFERLLRVDLPELAG